MRKYLSVNYTMPPQNAQVSAEKNKSADIPAKSINAAIIARLRLTDIIQKRY